MVTMDYEGANLEGVVLRIERSSIFDGDGFRTVVFLKGCPMRCKWCSTPESQCILPVEKADKLKYGRVMTVEEVLTEVRKDSPFYFHSGGGMTISGGELLIQSEFSRCILQQARREGINTTIETSLFGPWEKVESILRHVHTAYVDLKFMDSNKHLKYCGVSNDLIIENFLRTNVMNERYKIRVRIPLIPGINDSEEELRRMGKFAAKLEKLQYVQLLPYHRLGSDTYRKLGMKYELEDLRPPADEHMEWCREIVGSYVKVIK